MRALKLSPSILTLDFARLGHEVAAVEPYVDWFHLDVMDGHYVPNLTFGASVVEAVRRSCNLPLHVHLMIDNPGDFVGSFADAGAARISFHPEVCQDVDAVIEAISERGVGIGFAVHPDVDLSAVRAHIGELAVVLMMTVRPGFGGQKFMTSVLPKIAEARRTVDDAGAAADVEVDGGINLSTVDEVVAAGADIIVAGSAIYDGVDPGAAASRLRRRIDGAAETSPP
jgi:ribulose-phosphate 3-epimerase